jgi:DNA (cytosine-5)-methyltransferase 3A
MKVLSLFDGISCARVALDRLGYKDVEYYASEVDKYAIQISQRNYPDIVQLGSVVGLHFAQTDVGLLIGGSPCQDLSIAKKDRKGLAGDRSGLFWEYVRILKEVKPKYFILENVASMPKEAKALITETLGVETVMLDAALVSAQRRKRLFWVGKWNGTKYEQVVIHQPKDRGILLKDILEDGCAAKYNRIDGLKEDIEKSQALCASDWRGINRNQDQTAVYQYRRTYWRETKGGKVPTLTANMGTGGNNVPYVAEPVALRNRGEGKKPEYNGTGKANALTTVHTDSMVDMPPIRKLTVKECERLQSLPDGYCDGVVSNTQAYKALGNAFNVEVIKHILSFI